MIQHLRDCIAAFLAGKKTLLPAPEAGRNKPTGVPTNKMEKAFGLVRVTSGKPPIARDTLCMVAMEVLERRLLGETFEVARDKVAEHRRANGLQVSSETQVAEAWAAHRTDAIDYFRLYRAFDHIGWTDFELARLREIYAGVPGAVLPGEKPFTGRRALDD